MKIYSYNGRINICGKRIREARIKLGISQSELAARLQVENVDIEQKSISRIENEERFIADYELLVLSRVLNAKVDWLLTGK